MPTAEETLPSGLRSILSPWKALARGLPGTLTQLMGGLVPVGLALAFHAPLSLAGSNAVTLSQGTFHGADRSGIASFLGIPYALPPVGEQRWRPPLPVGPSTDEFSATAYGPACLQPESSFVQAPGGFAEDCLSLNVWSPSLEGRLPVMLWIHGGGFRSGSGVFPGEVLAERGVVVVSLNYRLGPLGFFSHQALASNVANFGLLDMELALEWVRGNIEEFGGDPEKVTIFGVSAGGQAVNLLMVSPRTEGLFQRAIAQSGYGTWALPRSASAPIPAPLAMDGEEAASAEALAEAILSQVGAGSATPAALRELDGMALVKAPEGFQLPIVDGTSLPEEPAIMFLRGQQRDVPYLSGGNSYEGSVMPASRVSDATFRSFFADRGQQARSLYAGDDDTLWLARAFGDYRYLLSARVLAEAMQQHPGSAWLYYVDFLPAGGEEEPGTAHGMDAVYLTRGHASSDPAVRALSDVLRNYWVNFALTGDPNGTGLPEWPAHAGPGEPWMVFSGAGIEARAAIPLKLDFWESLYRARVAPALPRRPSPP